MSSSQVRVLRSREEVESVRGFWNKNVTNPNAEMEFFLGIIDQRSEVLRPHVMVLERGGEPKALLAGRLETRKLDFKVGYARIFSSSARILTVVYGGAIGEFDAEDAALLVQAIENSLSAREFSVVVFNYLKRDHPLYRATIALPGIFSRDHFPVAQAHRSMALPCTIAEFQNCISPKVRKSQRWSTNRFLREFPGEVHVRSLPDFTNLDEMMSDLEEVASKTYQRRLGAGFVNNEEMRRSLQLQVTTGSLRVFVLYTKNRPSAYWIGTVCKSVFYSAYMGYDPQLSKHSPGMYLIMRAIEQMCSEVQNGKLHQLDFGLGDAKYKQALSSLVWEEATVYIFARSAKGLVLNLAHTLTTATDSLLKKGLGRFNLVQPIKTAWRRRLRKNHVKESPQLITETLE